MPRGIAGALLVSCGFAMAFVLSLWVVPAGPMCDEGRRGRFGETTQSVGDRKMGSFRQAAASEELVIVGVGGGKLRDGISSLPRMLLTWRQFRTSRMTYMHHSSRARDLLLWLSASIDRRAIRVLAL